MGTPIKIGSTRMHKTSSFVEELIFQCFWPLCSAYFFKKMGQPRPLFHLFSSFQTHITLFSTNKCEKCPFRIWCRNSNSRPLEHESAPITTWPGLSPSFHNNFSLFNWLYREAYRICHGADQFSINIFLLMNRLKVFPFQLPILKRLYNCKLRL